MSSDLEDLETRLDVADIEVSTYTPQSALEEIAQFTKFDAMLRDIIEFIVHGWPETDAELPEDLQLYYYLREEHAYHACCVVKGNRVTVPDAIRDNTNDTTWSSSGYAKMKALAQERVYWPMVHRYIESFVLRCKVCQEVGPRSNPIEPLQ